MDCTFPCRTNFQRRQQDFAQGTCGFIIPSQQNINTVVYCTYVIEGRLEINAKMHNKTIKLVLILLPVKSLPETHHQRMYYVLINSSIFNCLVDHFFLSTLAILSRKSFRQIWNIRPLRTSWKAISTFNHWLYVFFSTGLPRIWHIGLFGAVNSGGSPRDNY